MLMLDLCCGLGGASAAMRERGWTVITLDIDPVFKPDIVADLREWSWTGSQPDFIWISPPCTDFARDHLPWIKTDRAPDMSTARAAQRIVREVQPANWAVENVVGALRYFNPIFGPPRHMQRPYFLWGQFPPLGQPRIEGRRHKQSLSSARRADRALIPYTLSLAVALAVESQTVMELV
jgi:hypothetical protein